MHDPTARVRDVESAKALATAFRLGYAAKLALAIVVGAAAAVVVVYAVLAEDLGTFAQNAAIIGRTRQSVIGAAAMSGLLHIVLTGGVAIVLALFASHKIAGPTVRLARLLREVRDGRLPGEVHLRQGDQIQPLAAQFNEACQALYRRHEMLRQKLDDVRCASQRLRESLAASASGETLNTAAEELRARTVELRQILATACGDHAERTGG